MIQLSSRDEKFLSIVVLRSAVIGGTAQAHSAANAAAGDWV